jgi:hypothetical protein
MGYTTALFSSALQSHIGAYNTGIINPNAIEVLGSNLDQYWGEYVINVCRSKRTLESLPATHSPIEFSMTLMIARLATWRFMVLPPLKSRVMALLLFWQFVMPHLVTRHAVAAIPGGVLRLDSTLDCRFQWNQIRLWRYCGRPYLRWCIILRPLSWARAFLLCCARERRRNWICKGRSQCLPLPLSLWSSCYFCSVFAVVVKRWW